MRFRYALVAALLCSFMACQKEPDETLIPSATCRLEKILLHVGSPTAQDTIGIEYNGTQVSRINYPDYYVVPEFSNGLLARKKYYLRGTTDIFRIDQYTYNGDSTLSKVEAFAASGSQQAPTPTYRYLLSWNAKQLTELEFYEDTSGIALDQMSEEYFTYTGSNISRVIYYEPGTQYKDTMNFFYDSELNYFQKDPVLLLSDIFFVDITGLSMVFALSINNVTTFDSNHPSTTVNLTRDETDKAQLETLRVDGDLYSRYQYKCQ